MCVLATVQLLAAHAQAAGPPPSPSAHTARAHVSRTRLGRLRTMHLLQRLARQLVKEVVLDVVQSLGARRLLRLLRA